MNFFSFAPLPQKKQEVPDSELVNRLNKVSASNHYLIYKNITIYHHTKKEFVPLIILDISRGLYIFEYKTWSFKDLKNASITKAINQNPTDNNLAFDKTNKFIKQKFNELIHNDGVTFYNFLLMENLNSNEYEQLNDSIKKYLPSNRIIFNDSCELDILNKLKNIPIKKSSFTNANKLISNLLVQYLILSNDETVHLATKEQQNFIDSEISGHKTLYAKAKAGKTNCLLLHAILQILKYPTKKIIIIEPTTLACDILKQKLINTIERALIEIDMALIEIITPQELINKHLQKLKKNKLTDYIYIDDILMRKKFKSADLIMCDDSNLLPKEFILYLKHIQKNSNLLLVNIAIESEKDYIFEKNFRKDKNRNVIFKETNPFAKTLQLISSISQENNTKDILVISNESSKKNLYDDLKSFIKENIILFDSSKNLINQNLDNLLLASYSQLGSIDAKFIIMLDICSTPLEQLIYAANLGENNIYILYEKNCKDIDALTKELI